MSEEIDQLLSRLSKEADSEMALEKYYFEENEYLYGESVEIVGRFSNDKDRVLLEKYFSDIFSSQAVELNIEILDVIDAFSEWVDPALKGKIIEFIKKGISPLVLYDIIDSNRKMKNEYRDQLEMSDAVDILGIEGIAIDMERLLYFRELLNGVQTKWFQGIITDGREAKIFDGSIVEILNQLTWDVEKLMDGEWRARYHQKKVDLEKDGQAFQAMDQCLIAFEEKNSDMDSAVIFGLQQELNFVAKVNNQSILYEFYKQYIEEGHTSVIAEALARAIEQSGSLPEEGYLLAKRYRIQHLLSPIDAYNQARNTMILKKVESREMKTLVESYTKSAVTLRGAMYRVRKWVETILDNMKSEDEQKVRDSIERGYHPLLALDEYFVGRRTAYNTNME